MDATNSDLELAKIAADIVVAFVARNSVEAGELPALTMQIKNALGPSGESTVVSFDPPAAESFVSRLAASRLPAEPEPHDASPAGESKAPRPAVPVSKSMTHDHIYCLEDGQKFRSLRRHLRQAHGMTPEQYREKWGLPQHYQLVAPGYSEVRTGLAKKQGLGLRPEDLVHHEGHAPKVAAE